MFSEDPKEDPFGRSNDPCALARPLEDKQPHNIMKHHPPSPYLHTGYLGIFFDIEATIYNCVGLTRIS